MDRASSVPNLRDNNNAGGIAQRFTDLGIGNGGNGEFAIITSPAVAAGVSASVLAGQLATSTTAAPLEAVGSGHASAEVYVQNDPASTTGVLLGTAKAQTIPLAPGQGAWFPCLNTSQIVVAAVSGTPNVNWLSRVAAGAAVTSMTTTAAALSTTTCVEVVIQADVSNPVNILVGDATHQYVSLAPGQTFRAFVANSNVLYLKAASSSAGVTAYYQCRVKL